MNIMNMHLQDISERSTRDNLKDFYAGLYWLLLILNFLILVFLKISKNCVYVVSSYYFCENKICRIWWLLKSNWRNCLKLKTLCTMSLRLFKISDIKWCSMFVPLCVNFTYRSQRDPATNRQQGAVQHNLHELFRTRQTNIFCMYVYTHLDLDQIQLAYC